MTPPYAPGQHLAWIDPDPDGIRVHRATVTHIEATNEPDYWRVSTDRGNAVVDSGGHSGRIVPIDVDIAAELYLKGDGYLIHPTVTDQHRVLEQDTNDASLYLDTDLGDDLDID